MTRTDRNGQIAQSNVEYAIRKHLQEIPEKGKPEKYYPAGFDLPVADFYRLGQDICSYIDNHEDKPYRFNVVKEVVDYAEVSKSLHIKEVISSLRRLLLSDVEPVLVYAGLRCHMNSFGDVPVEYFSGQIVEEIEKVITQAAEELDLGSLADAPVEMYIEFIQPRFDEQVRQHPIAQKARQQQQQQL